LTPDTLTALDTLRSLPRDWDHYGADPIDPRAIGYARAIVTNHPASVAPQVVPLPRGRVQLEWRKPGRALDVAIYTDGWVHYLLTIDATGVEREAILRGDVIGDVIREFDAASPA
jgi:hypothetical protein